MRRTENDFYRVVLQEVYQIPANVLELMTDAECAVEFSFRENQLLKRLH